MAVIMLSALPQQITPGMRLLGIDAGSMRVGLALSDRGRIAASPLLVLHRGKFRADAAKIAEIVAKEEVGGIIIGLPINMDGSEGPRCQSVKQFAQNLSAIIPQPIAFWDERLSTVAVNKMMLAADFSRKKRAAIVDKLAATYILQGALDALHNLSKKP